MRNSIYNVAYKLLDIVFPLVTSIYIAHILLPDSIGRVAAAQNLVNYFVLTSAMGIPSYGVKAVAQYQVGSRESSRVFTELYVINLLSSVIFSTCYYLLIYNAAYFNGNETLYAICGINVLFNIFNVDWFYQGIQQYAYITVRSFIIKLLALVALFIFVKTPADYLYYALISSGALVGNYIFNMIHIKRYIHVEMAGLHLKEHFQHIVTLFSATIAIEIYALTDTTMLDFLCTSAAVGYYTMSMKIIRIIRGVVLAISATFLPKMSYSYYNGQREDFFQLANKGLHILTALSLPAAAGLFLVSDEAVIIVFGKAFFPSALTTRILSLSIVTVAFSNYIGMQILLTLGKEKITTFSTVCGAVLNVIMNYFLIKAYQHTGAAIASVITELVVMIIELLFARKYLKLQFGLVKALLATFFMSIAVCTIKVLPLVPVLKLVIEFISGFFVYFCALLLLKDSFALSVEYHIKKYVLKRVKN